MLCRVFLRLFLNFIVAKPGSAILIFLPSGKSHHLLPKCGQQTFISLIMCLICRKWGLLIVKATNPTISSQGIYFNSFSQISLQFSSPIKCSTYNTKQYPTQLLYKAFSKEKSAPQKILVKQLWQNSSLIKKSLQGTALEEI